MSSAQSIYTKENLEKFTKLDFKEQMLRIVDVTGSAKTLLHAAVARRDGRLTQEQFDEVERLCLTVVDNIGLEQQAYVDLCDKLLIEMSAVFPECIGQTSDDEKRKMN